MRRPTPRQPSDWSRRGTRWAVWCVVLGAAVFAVGYAGEVVDRDTTCNKELGSRNLSFLTAARAAAPAARLPAQLNVTRLTPERFSTWSAARPPSVLGNRRQTAHNRILPRGYLPAASPDLTPADLP